MDDILTLDRISPRRYLAWCKCCEDGFAGRRLVAQAWMDRHRLTERHLLNAGPVG